MDTPASPWKGRIMTDPLFTGVGVALVTLFHADGGLDAKATAAHAATLADLGVRAIVLAGTTGEAAALSAEERDTLLAEVRAAVTGVPVVAGTGAAWGPQAAELTRRARDGGADGVLVLSPPRTPDPRPYYDCVTAAAGDMPVLAYHFPAASLPGIPLDALADLRVAGMKDSSGDADRLLEELAAFSRPLYVGSSALLALAGPLGCAGAILALANAEPERCAAAFAGDARTQRELGPAHRAGQRAFPHGIKELTAERFGTSPVCRLG
jgi:4-hydroxy-tetrahydrodipicolinate synthase